MQRTGADTLSKVASEPLELDYRGGIRSASMLVREDRQGRCTNLSVFSWFWQGLQRGLDATLRFCILRGSSSCRLQAISDHVLHECGSSCATSLPDWRYISHCLVCLVPCEVRWTVGGSVYVNRWATPVAYCHRSKGKRCLIATLGQTRRSETVLYDDIVLGLAGRRRRHQ